MSDAWSGLLVDQLDWHWTHQFRPRLSGLTDDEYHWEPVSSCWRVCPDDATTAFPLWGTGPFRMEQAESEPEPAPVTK